MKTIRLLPLAALLAVSATAQAGSFSYDYVEGAFGEVDVGAGANDGDAIYLGGAMGLDKQLGLLGSIGFVDYGNNADGMVLRGGGLFHTNLQKDLDLFATVELVYSTWDAPPGADDDDIGLAAAGGLRYAIKDNLQVSGKLTLVEVDPFDDGLGLSVEGRYYLDKQLSAAVGLASDAEFDGLFVNLRYDLK